MLELQKTPTDLRTALGFRVLGVKAPQRALDTVPDTSLNTPFTRLIKALSPDPKTAYNNFLVHKTPVLKSAKPIKPVKDLIWKVLE